MNLNLDRFRPRNHFDTGKSIKDIFYDDNLPLKIRRRLILLKLGFNIDEQFHFPLNFFIQNFNDVFVSLSKLGWKRVDVNPALSTETEIGGMPHSSVDIPSINPSYKREIVDKLKSLSQNPENDFVILYQDAWEDPEIIGGNTMYFRGQKGLVEDKFRIELQQNTWPRNFKPEKGNYLRINYQLQPLRKTWGVIGDPSHKCLVAKSCAVKLFSKDETILSVEKLYEITENKKTLVLIWQYYNKILTILDWYFG